MPLSHATHSSPSPSIYFNGTYIHKQRCYGDEMRVCLLRHCHAPTYPHTTTTTDYDGDIEGALSEAKLRRLRKLSPPSVEVARHMHGQGHGQGAARVHFLRTPSQERERERDAPREGMHVHFSSDTQYVRPALASIREGTEFLPGQNSGSRGFQGADKDSEFAFKGSHGSDPRLRVRASSSYEVEQGGAAWRDAREEQKEKAARRRCVCLVVLVGVGVCLFVCLCLSMRMGCVCVCVCVCVCECVCVCVSVRKKWLLHTPDACVWSVGARPPRVA